MKQRTAEEAQRRLRVMKIFWFNLTWSYFSPQQRSVG